MRFKTSHAGRRSFKTEYAKRAVVTYAMTHPNVNLFFGSPTRTQAKAIAWIDFKQLTKMVTVEKSDTELWLRLITGSRIHVIGLDKPERTEGQLWHGGVLDEFADMKPNVWNENLQPALADTKGWCWFIGVPAGKNHYYDLCEYSRTSGDPEWADYSWFSADVLDPQEMESKRKTLDARTYRQEFEGSFESYEGRAFMYYDSSVHRKPTLYDRRFPLSVSCDFNLDPCIWVIGQDKGGLISAQDEIVQKQTDIWKMCAELKLRLNRLAPQKLIFYGDYQHGKTRSVSAVASSWTIVKSEFPQADFRIRPNPRIIDGVNAVNSKMRSATGAVLFELDPKCQESHKDFEQVSTNDIFERTEGKDRGHASSTFRYWMFYEYPVREHAIWRAV